MDQMTSKTDFEYIELRALIISLNKGRIDDKNIPDAPDNILNSVESK